MTVLCKVPTHIVNPLLTPSPLPPGLFISNTFEGETGSIEVGGLFDRWGGGGLINLAKMMVSVLHEELECKVEKSGKAQPQEVRGHATEDQKQI